MHILKLSFLIILLPCASIEYVSNQWCYKERLVPKTRLRSNTGLRRVTRMDFWGNVMYKNQEYTYTTTEFYNAWENVRECCRGYEKVNYLHCRPICSEKCPEFATCFAPDECRCSNGYTLGRGKDNTLLCMPTCADTCPDHSFCDKPNSCKCDSGYKKSFYGDCKPMCDSPCPENASCSAPNNCTCNEGYEMLETNLCQPICNGTCPKYSHCIKPNKCGCLDGYSMKLSSSYNLFCEPQCQQNCSTFATCVQPNKCECIEGYEMDEGDICRPICSKGCRNGLCNSPEVCICHSGWLMGPNEQCEPVCSVPCQNATCVEPEICQCSPGYKMKNDSVSVCEPQCQPECINGVCIDANICICLENYEPVITPEGISNHSNCKAIDTTTTTTDATSKSTINTETSSDFSYELSTEITRDTTTSFPMVPPMASSDNCLQQCQCWEEYDEFGPLTQKPKCVRFCLDPFDRPCLNASLCKCESTSQKLHCQLEDDIKDSSEEDEPVLYVCKIPIPEEKKEIKRNEKIKQEDGENKLWLILGTSIGVASLVAMASVVFKRFRIYQDRNRIIEYEM